MRFDDIVKWLFRLLLPAFAVLVGMSVYFGYWGLALMGSVVTVGLYKAVKHE